MKTKATTTKHKTSNTNKKKGVSRTDWERLKRIRRGQEKIDTSDIPEADDKTWTEMTFGSFEAKTSISVRFDTDVLRWFKSQGPRYQTRMNEVLRAYMLCKQNNLKHKRA